MQSVFRSGKGVEKRPSHMLEGRERQFELAGPTGCGARGVVTLRCVARLGVKANVANQLDRTLDGMRPDRGCLRKAYALRGRLADRRFSSEYPVPTRR